MLVADTAHSLADGAGERWPVIDEIPFLRTGRDTLVAEALALLDEGRKAEAVARLLADQDDWWTGPSPENDRLATLVRQRDKLTFREAMDHLGFGRVGDYLAHRWSDPTYLAGLALLEAHWVEPDRVFELACGTGAYLREMCRRGFHCTGGDVVFAKLWLARHFIVGSDVELICFDASSPWPIAGRSHGLVLCHDAFYFMQPKAAVAERLRAATAADGLLAIAHVHNSSFSNMSAGNSIGAAALETLFPGATFYDDAELTSALIETRSPRPQRVADLSGVEAFSLALGDKRPPRPVVAGLALPPADAVLRKNPLYGADGTVAWPSERYRAEYSARATYPLHSQPSRGGHRVSALDAQARTRELVDLPERW